MQKQKQQKICASFYQINRRDATLSNYTRVTTKLYDTSYVMKNLIVVEKNVITWC